MMMTLLAVTRRFVPVTTLGVLCVFSAVASPIFVSNFSFETLPVGGLPNGCGAGCSFSTGAIPGWTGGTVGTSGQFQPGAPGNTTWFTTLSDGPTSAFTNAPTLSQTVLPTVQVGEVYTLLVDLGKRNDQPFDASADLLINGKTLLATGIIPTSGHWSTYSLVYTGLAADAGQAITIQLKTTGIEGNFDNVRLDGTITGIPEPSGVTLLGLGLVGLSVFARRKRAS